MENKASDPGLVGEGTGGRVVRPAVFSAEFKKLNPGLNPGDYVTKIFFQPFGVSQEMEITKKVSDIFKTSSSPKLFLEVFEDWMDVKEAKKYIKINPDNWGDYDKIMVLHYRYGGVDLDSVKVPKIETALGDLFRTVEVLNGAMIIHRDIKAANVLYDASSDALRLIDYGLAKWVDPTAGLPAYDNYGPATIYYEPPECILNVGKKRLGRLVMELGDIDNNKNKDSKDLLEMMVKQRALCLTGHVLRDASGDALEMVLGGVPEYENETVPSPPPKRQKTDVSGRVPFSSLPPRVGLLWKEMKDVALGMHSALLSGSVDMGTIVKAYNAYQVGQLIRSLERKFGENTELEKMSTALFAVDMQTRIKAWDDIVSGLPSHPPSDFGAPGSSEPYAACARCHHRRRRVCPGTRLSALSSGRGH
jgi:serine/threonine protein kinase